MHLGRLLKSVSKDYQKIQVRGISFDSRKVKKGDIFFAIKGNQTSGIKFINDENPFGLNLDDPNGKDDLLVDSGDLHLQIDKPVKFLLRSLDVIHNFYIPQFRGKMDMLPGHVTFYWLTPIRTGDFEVLCAEFCGVGHYAMRGRVFVDEEKNYNQWLAQQITFEKMLAQNKIDNKSLKLVKNIE